MLFSSIPFLYFFLPLVIITYFLAPKKLKNLVLLVFSLVFYAWGEPQYVILMIVTIGMFYGCGLAIGRCQSQKFRKFWLIVSIVVSIGLLGVFKYADFFVESFNTATGLSIPLLRLALPIGISFYTFQCLSYVIDVYRGFVPPQKNIIHFSAYVSLFPQLIAGPIVRYIDVARELEQRKHSWDNVAVGLRRFIIGLAKKIIIADNFALLIKLFRQTDSPSVAFYWMYAIAFTLNIYFDFSGYSDMAIGLGRVFGFHFIENFNYPFLSKSTGEFWRRWHISLGSWFRDYIYFPLGGNRVPALRYILNLLVVWMVTGLWHGAQWTFVVWGLIYAFFKLLEGWFPGIKKLPAFFGHLYTMLIVIFSFVLFNAESFAQAGSDIACMLGLGGLPLVTDVTLYYLASYALLFVVGIVGATPLVRDTAVNLSKHKVFVVLEPAALVVLLLLCTGYLVDGSFSPFLYFRF